MNMSANSLACPGVTVAD
jgi:hypothetical protein